AEMLARLSAPVLRHATFRRRDLGRHCRRSTVSRRICMRILIIGGTRFLGRAIAEYAVGRAHDVTLFHRAKSMPNGLPGAASIAGDRAHDLGKITEPYDAIVDTCAYLPRDVVASCTHISRLSPNATYVLISSASVYRDGFPSGADESAPTIDDGDQHASEMTLETYGALKALCERAAIECFGNNAFVVRPGLIVGPYDGSDRFTYWVRRIGAGGRVLVPAPPDRAVQFVDVRDLAGWIVAALEARCTGTFNATGPEYRLTFGTLLDACRTALQSDAEFFWAPQAFLKAHEVEPWTQMPLWIPDDEAGGWDEISSRRAIDAGLRFRPLRDTILDTARWDRSRDQNVPLKAGITAEREAALLKELEQTA